MEVRAAGLVLFRREAAGHRYLLLTNARHGDVGLPKGHAEPGEDELATALRETEEETGLRPARLCRHLRREVRYPVGRTTKVVTYYAAEASATAVRLSREHSAHAWLDLDAALASVRHERLRSVLHEAALYLKDPLLRRGLDPAAARELLVASVGPDAPVVAHTAAVVAMARTLAAGWGGLDAAYVEAAAWVHDIGRSVTHGMEHSLEGFGLLMRRGFGGYAAPCLSHYTKGRPLAECGPLGPRLWAACDLDTFEIEERLIALADFLAAGDRRVTLEERHRDLAARYGRSDFLDGSLGISRQLKGEWEGRTGRELYDTLAITDRRG